MAKYSVFQIIFLLVFFLWQMKHSECHENRRSFQVDYRRNIFLKDGQPYRYISGEIHYFRIHSSLWADRLMRVRHAGLNAIQVYVPWNYHEVVIGDIDFKEEKNLVKFLELAQQNGLDVLLRIGPYVCAEWENGGLPWWLLREEMNLRTADSRYLDHVKRWFDALLPVIKPLLYKNGGPILMLQIENEYGSVLCDKVYLRWLRDEVRRQLGSDTVLYTTDGPSDKQLGCGSVEDTFTTVDFGVVSSFQDVQKNFALQRKYSKGGPSVNSEFYTVWFSEWGQKGPAYSQNIETTLRAMTWIHSQNASFSLYMIHGGTNFDFWNGAETDGPVLTSYDYSAPISEEGQITQSYLAIRDWIKKLPNPYKPLSVPLNRTGVTIDKIKNVVSANLVTVLDFIIDKRKCVHSIHPVSFERLDNFYNLVWYRTILKGSSGAVLKITNLRDYAYVFVDEVYEGFMTVCDKSSCVQNLTLKTPAKSGQIIDLIVESYGRQTFPTKRDPKGILSDVTLDGNSLLNWVQCGVDPVKISNSIKRQFKAGKAHKIFSRANGDEAYGGPTIYAAPFEANLGWAQFHTFFDSRDWGKGVLLLNGFNVGRYWPIRGPQMTLFVPGAVLRDENLAIIFELIGRPVGGSDGEVSINFASEPIYDYKK